MSSHPNPFTSYLVGVDGVEVCDSPVYVRQWRARAIAGDHSILAFSHSQINMTDTDLGEI